MKLCPTCQRCYEDTDETCVQAGHESLVAARPGETVIADKYRIESLVARGGMGAVYAGTHVELDRPIAIKLLLPDLNADTQALDRFRREARAAARIKHPNVADIYDYGSLHDGEAYIVMELVEGQTLSEHLRQAGQLSFAETISLSRQIATGMEAAHRSGVVHRDLKPSNIILTQGYDGGTQVKIIDFGIAKISEQIAAADATLTATGVLVGTPRYMSPEQCLGQELDPRSDIYSFGVILYEMLAGQPPFDASSAVAIAFKHLHEPVPPLNQFRQNVPPLLASLITESLSVEPANRPQSAAELERRLAEAEETLGDYAALDEAQPIMPYEAVEDDPLRTQVIADEKPAVPAAAVADEYATAVYEAEDKRNEADAVKRNVAVEVDSKEVETPHLFDIGSRTLHRAVPLTLEPPAAGAHAPSGSFSTSSPSGSFSTSGTSASFNTGGPSGALSDETLVAKRRTRRPQRASLYTGLAALLIIGAIVWAVLQRNPSSPSAASSPTASPAATGKDAKKSGPPQKDGTPTAEAVSPEAGNGAPVETKEEPASAEARAEIKGALDEWIAATNAGDVGRQMTFYNPTVNAFYRTRNVSREDVRAEKQRLFEQADRIDVQAGDPDITISPDGQTATTRFRKRYVIEGEDENRRGEVLQELRWINTDDGWKIISERDLRVIRPSSKPAPRRGGNAANASNRPDQVVVRGMKKLFQVIR